MSEADGSASQLEALCQQVTTLTQAVQRQQEGCFQLEGHLQHLTVTLAHVDQDPSPASSTTAAPAQERTTTTQTVVVPPPEPRVPTPE